MMEAHTDCGFFGDPDVFFPVAEEVCKEHFTNMDVDDRATVVGWSDWNGGMAVCRIRTVMDAREMEGH